MLKINPLDYENIVFFTGAGMSAESGVPTYRGSGGIWDKYRWDEFACQDAFDENPKKVLEFHEIRRKAVLDCKPHKGHFVISELEKKFSNKINIITQNIDGMHQRAGSKNVVEMHGSLWRLVCPNHGIIEDLSEKYESYKCKKCGSYLRPDIIWFGDSLNIQTISEAKKIIEKADLFISIGTSAVVFPAAGFPQIAKDLGAFCIEINPEKTSMSNIYDENIRQKAQDSLTELFL